MKSRVRFTAVMGAVMSILGSVAASGQTPAGRTVQGTVYDSLSGAPLARATVSIMSRSDTAMPPRTVQSDAAGGFAFQNLSPGAYLLGFQAPVLDSLGVTSPTKEVDLSADGRGALIANLAIPSARTVHDAFCPARPRQDSTSVLIGHLGNATDRGVVANGDISATWVVVARDAKNQAVVTARQARATSGQDGWFALCDLPPNSTIAVHAISGADTSSLIYVITPGTRGLIRREIYIASRLAPTTGVIVGRVRASDGGHAIAGAQIRADASGKTVTADDSGRFTLSGLPYGSSDLSVRAIGYVPQRIVVDVLVGDPTRLNVSLLTGANVLAAVRTNASRSVNANDGFDKRRTQGWGRFFDADDIARLHAWDVNDIVRATPGLKPMGLGFHSVIRMNSLFDPVKGCIPYYYLDGRQLTDVVESQDLEVYVQAQDLAGVEIYNRPEDAPPQFRPITATCGSIVMWTIYYKGNGH